MRPDGECLWASLFFQGKRLEAEVVLHSQRLSGTGLSEAHVLSGLQQLQRAWGRELAEPEAALPPLQAAYQEAGEHPLALKGLIQREPGYPDPLLLLALRPINGDSMRYWLPCHLPARDQLVARRCG